MRRREKNPILVFYEKWKLRLKISGHHIPNRCIMDWSKTNLGK